MECEEARFALKPWPSESVVVRQLDKSKCTCEAGMTSEARASEIATEIGKTLLQAQQLREKLAAKLHRERQSARKPDLVAIYSKPRLAPAGPASKDAPRSPRSRPGVQPQRRISRDPGKSRQQPTNFVLANKRSVCRPKSLQRPSAKPAQPAYRSSSNCTRAARSKSEEKEADSMIELNRLIEMFAQNGSSPRASGCPVHAENSEQPEEKVVVTMLDAVEGLDRLGVPPRLVGVLRTYHAFLRSQSADELAVMVGKRRAEAADEFLNKFKRMNEKRKSLSSAKCQQRQLLVAELSSLYHKSYADNLSAQEVKALKSKFISLDGPYSECDVKNLAGELKFTRSNAKEVVRHSPDDRKNWISNGVWNHSCIDVLKDVFGDYCTRYSDRSQLMSFHDLIQNVQRNAYKIELIELLLSSVIPAMHELVDPNSQDYLEMYKLIVAVLQVINIRVPVLAEIED